MANSERIGEWTAALRSGKYQQGASHLLTLEDDEGIVTPLYCCLGVACDLSGVGWWVGKLYFTPGHPKADADLPLLVRNYYALARSNPEVFAPEARDYANDHYARALLNDADLYTLSDLNDHFGLPFPLIADIIDGNVQEGRL